MQIIDWYYTEIIFFYQEFVILDWKRESKLQTLPLSFVIKEVFMFE